MIILEDDTKTLEMFLGEAATTELPYFVSFQDTSSKNVSTYGTKNGTTNDTTDVTICSAPANIYRRLIQNISVRNSDNVTHVVTIQLDDTATERTIIKTSILVDETLHYEAERGWYVTDANGGLKSGLANSVTSLTVTSLTATRVVFAGTGGVLSDDSGFTFNTTGDILTVGSINVAGTTAPTTGWYNPSGTLLRTPNALTIDGAQ